MATIVAGSSFAFPAAGASFAFSATTSAGKEDHLKGDQAGLGASDMVGEWCARWVSGCGGGRGGGASYACGSIVDLWEGKVAPSCR